MLELEENPALLPDSCNIMARTEACKSSREKEAVFQVMNGQFQCDTSVEPFFRYLRGSAR